MSQTFITVIRHSLAAATAALDLLENSPQNVVVKGCDTVQRIVESAPVIEGMPVVEAPCSVAQTAGETVPAPAAAITLAILTNELYDGRFTLRTLTELAAIAGIDEDDVMQTLRSGGVAFVTKTRRHDRATLIGLASRN